MKYKIYKLSFQTAVHFGNGSLEDGEYTFLADTLFSALCQEACKVDSKVLSYLYERSSQGCIIFSDAFPYMGNTYFLPKPMRRIAKDTKTANSILKKAYKKLKYIPVDAFGQYLRGEYDVLHAVDFSELGMFESKVSVSISGEDEPKPYRVGQFYFKKNNGLYFVLGYESQKDMVIVESLLKTLAFSGIGGKRSSGYGRFSVSSQEVPIELEKRFTKEGKSYMTLSVGLPKNEELEAAMDGAEYSLMKRSGFVASNTYAKEQHRKRDLYVFKAGACFTQKFSGDIYDVSHEFGSHAVYRYAKPLFMEVDA